MTYFPEFRVGRFVSRFLVRSSAMFVLLLLPLVARAGEPVRIAYLAPLSGPFALVFEESLKQFQAAADLVNGKGGVLAGRRLEIVAFDNKGTPQETLSVLKRVIDQDIRYVAATISSVALALSDAIAKHNERNPERRILFLGYDAREPSLTEAKCNFWHFRFHPHSDMQLEVLTDYIASQPAVRKVYLLNQDYAWGHSVRRAAKEMLARKRADIQIVGDDLIALGKVKDFSSYVTKIAASNADSVLTSNWGNDLSLLIRASQEFGLKAHFYTTHAWVVGTPAAIGSAGADRVKTVMAWHINAAGANWEERMLHFEQKYMAIAHMDFLPIWQTIDMFATAIEKAHSAEPLKVAYALEGMEYHGPAGYSWMRAEDHQIMAPIFITSLVKAGTPGVKHDNEKTGLGWETVLKVEAEKTVPPIRCQMQRPAP